MFRNLFSKKKLDGYYFIHIPKTAGTSFINILDACVDESDIFPCQLWREINQDIVDKKLQYKLLRGHFGGGSYKLLANNPHRLTILRNPLSLSVSTYHFIKREKNTAVHSLVTNKDMSLKDFLEEPLTAHKINDRMTRHLSFDLQQDPGAQELFLSSESIKVISNWIKTPKKITHAKRLLRAKRVLDECSWFGIQEKFDESMQLFAYQFNRPPIGATPFLNAHKPNQDIDSHCQNLINKQNQNDLKLYKYATDEFNSKYSLMLEQLKQLPDSGSKTVDELIDLNYYNHYSHKQHISIGIQYNFSNELLGSGWHRREMAQPENTFFRWTNNKNSFIDFWLQPKDYELQIRIINAVSIMNLDKLELQINNSSFSYKYDQQQGVVRILTAIVPASAFNGNLLRINLVLANNLKHSQVFDSDDNRSLGIAINWIRISPCQKATQQKK